jgi:Fic-DOC domain mobile mystery protein B
MLPDPAAESLSPVAITAGERSRLVPSLSTREQLNEIESLGITAARMWAMRPATLRRPDLLTEEFSRELHRRMFSGIWRGAGRYRTGDGGAGWEPGQISKGMRMFLDDADGWIRFGSYPVHESALRLHHRLVALRPWANGNGRHARLLADVLVAAHGEAPLTWGAGMGPGEIGSQRAGYVNAMKAADSGDFGPLLEFARG